MDPDTLDAEVAKSNAEPSPATDVKDKETATPSTAKDEKKQTLADVVRDAAAKSVESSTTEKEAEETDESVDKTTPDASKEDSSEKDEKAEKAEVADEKDKELPFHKHPRFPEVIKEPATSKQRMEELTL